MSDLPAAIAFLGLQDSFDDAAVAVLPVPYDLTTIYQPAARFGPRALLTASLAIELFDAELRWDASEVGIHTLPALEPTAAGPQEMIPEIGDALRSLFNAGKFPIMIGGDPSVTLGALEALKESWEEVWIIQFGARPNLYDTFQGTPLSHACVMARVREEFPAMHVGVRSWGEEEDVALWEQGERVITAEAIARNREGACDQLLAEVGDPVYLTIDLGCLDPAIMPAVGLPEPGGLAWPDFMHLLRAVAQERHVVGFDVTGLSPIAGLGAPDHLAARTVYKLLAYTFHARRQQSEV